MSSNVHSEESKQDGDLDDWIMTVKGQHYGQHFSSKKHASAADVAAATAMADEQSLPPPTSSSMMQKQHNGGAGGLMLLQTTTTSASAATAVGSNPASPVTTPTTPTSANSNGPLGMAMQRDANLNHYKLNAVRHILVTMSMKLNYINIVVDIKYKCNFIL